MLLSDLREIKSILDIEPGDKSEDRNLNFYVEWASQWIGEIINRPHFSYRQRVEFYQGTGTQKLVLRSTPVYAPVLFANQNASQVIQVYLDTNGSFGSSQNAFYGYSGSIAASGSNPQNTALTYGTDFCLQVDQPVVFASGSANDGLGISRSGILYRINDLWYKPKIREGGYLFPYVGPDVGSIMVIYYAGWTVDTLPSVFRMACNTLVAKMRFLFPLGMELGNNSYEEYSIGILAERKDYLTSLVKQMLWTYRNFNW